MKKRISYVVVIAIALLAGSCKEQVTNPAAGGNNSVGSISGKVTDQTTGQGVSGVTVTTQPATTTVTTDANGNYTIPNVPAGNFIVSLSNYGVAGKSITVQPATNVTVNFSIFPLEMVLIPGGTYTMGDTFGDGTSTELPTHQVTLTSFRMSKTEVTQKQWFAVMGTRPSYWTGDNLPVEMVNWYDAVSFCNKLSISAGLTPCYTINGNPSPPDWTSGTIVMSRTGGYRLPTEAEWEYAGSGGSGTKTKYAGTSDVSLLGNYAWYNSNSISTTHTVGTKAPNVFGLNDMSGNVCEWCWDWYGNYGSAAQTNPTGAVSGTYRVLRGGSWGSYNNVCRVSLRLDVNPVSRSSYVGARVSVDL